MVVMFLRLVSCFRRHVSRGPDHTRNNITPFGPIALLTTFMNAYFNLSLYNVMFLARIGNCGMVPISACRLFSTEVKYLEVGWFGVW